MDTRNKIVSLEPAAELAARLRAEGRRLVLAAGHFDVLRAAHARFLRQIRSDGEALLVVVYDDASAGKALLPEQARAQLVAALAVVDQVLIWPQPGLHSLVERLQPDRLERACQDERNIIGEVLERHR